MVFKSDINYNEWNEINGTIINNIIKETKPIKKNEEKKVYPKEREVKNNDT